MYTLNNTATLNDTLDDTDIQTTFDELVEPIAVRVAKPRCAAAFSPDDHWLFEFLQVPTTVRYYHDKAYRDDLHRAANAITQQYVGKSFFDEDTLQHSPKRIENLFGCSSCRPTRSICIKRDPFTNRVTSSASKLSVASSNSSMVLKCCAPLPHSSVA